jgi:short-subunit dehydrogenase
MPRIREPVVVITGASSGIGRATAHAFAKHRAKLVLAARRAEPLAQVSEECRKTGSDALCVAVDVADDAEVEAVRTRAVEAFGRIDVWVNCAAVLVFGRFEDIPSEVIRRTIETNLFGYINGSRTALLQFRAQGSHGVLINVGSVLGVVGEPYASIYVLTKFAIRGLSACLRQEAKSFPNIHVCAVLPAAHDTPIYQKAANYSHRKIRSVFPVYDPARAAEAIVRVVDRPQREVIVGGFGRLLSLGVSVAPAFIEAMVGRFGPTLQFQVGSMEASRGNLFESNGDHAVRGGWREYWRERLTGR